MKRSLAKSIAAINIAVGLLTVVGLALCVFLQLRLVALQDQTEVLALAGRRQALADMHHDGLKGSLYRTLYDVARSAENHQALVDDMREQSEGLEKQLKALGELRLPAAAASALAGSEGPMRAYIAEAKAVASIALDGRFDAANERLPEFEKSFSVLAEINEKVGDRIEAETSALAEDARAVTWKSKVVFASIAALLLGALVGQFIFLRRRIMRPLTEIGASIRRISAGDFEKQAGGRRGSDEIGEVFGALDVFRSQSLAQRSLEQKNFAEQAQRQERQARLEASVAAFRKTIATTRVDLARGVSSLSSATGAISAAAVDAEAAAGAATTSASGSASVAERIAEAAAAIQHSIGAVTTELGQASSTVERTSLIAKASTERVSALAGAANEIGSVVDVIRGIAEQTNLLALNATIEAARAGDAGRSFAVVAGEVKTLASRTASATDEIGQRVEDIKSATTSTVEAIGKMIEAFAQVENVVRVIAVATEKQSQSVTGIGNAAARAVGSSTVMSQSIERVASVAAGTRSASATIEAVSAEISRVAGELDLSVDNLVAAAEAA